MKRTLELIFFAGFVSLTISIILMALAFNQSSDNFPPATHRSRAESDWSKVAVAKNNSTVVQY
jgi:hypothetical protein